MAIEGIEGGIYYIIKLDDNFTAKNVSQVRQLAEEATGVMGHKVIVFDVKQSTYIDSTALGFIVNLYKKRIMENDGKIGFLCADRNIKELIRISNINRFVEFFENEDEIDDI